MEPYGKLGRVPGAWQSHPACCVVITSTKRWDNKPGGWLVLPGSPSCPDCTGQGGSDGSVHPQQSKLRGHKIPAPTPKARRWLHFASQQGANVLKILGLSECGDTKILQAYQYTMSSVLQAFF